MSSGKLRESIPTIDFAPAYWISPDGKILSNFRYHMDSVCENPAAFGLSREFLESVYNKYKEPWGSEGRTREEVMSLLLGKGWIRIRYFPASRYYAVDLQELTETSKFYVWLWAKALLKAGGVSKGSLGVNIKEFGLDYKVTSGTVGDLVAYQLFSRVLLDRVTLVPVNSAFDL